MLTLSCEELDGTNARSNAQEFAGKVALVTAKTGSGAL
jgi:hypothetical protein